MVELAHVFFWISQHELPHFECQNAKKTKQIKKNNCVYMICVCVCVRLFIAMMTFVGGEEKNYGLFRFFLYIVCMYISRQSINALYLSRWFLRESHT